MLKMEKTGHMVWCALIALLTASSDGRITSALQEDMFITRWLIQAKKQRRFSRDVTTDIDWILSQASSLGRQARLRDKLFKLWDTCSGELEAQSDLFRLICSMDMLRQSGWSYCVVSDREWGRASPYQESSILLLKDSLEMNFSDEGEQLCPLPIRIYGVVDTLNRLLKQCGWEVIYHDPVWELTTCSPVITDGKDAQTLSGR